MSSMKNWLLLLAIAFSSLAHAQEAPEPKHGVDVRVLHHFMDVEAHSATKTTISHSLPIEHGLHRGEKGVRCRDEPVRTQESRFLTADEGNHDGSRRV